MVTAAVVGAVVLVASGLVLAWWGVRTVLQRLSRMLPDPAMADPVIVQKLKVNQRFTGFDEQAWLRSEHARVVSQVRALRDKEAYLCSLIKKPADVVSIGSGHRR